MSKKFACLILIAVAFAETAEAFSLIGPRPDWQTDRRGYAGGFGPMNMGEEYRWNVPTVYYGYDSTFLNYFGARGAEEVDKVFQILNNLPNMSAANLDDFPLDTRRPNPRAEALDILDLKSSMLGFIMSHIGLEDPQEWVFTLRNVIDTPAPCLAFFVIRRNFDPVTFQTSSFINGTLWTYRDIFCTSTVAFPINEPVDPLFNNEPVTSTLGFFGQFGIGQFHTGLTRDDVGGLRYVYRRMNQNYETAVGGTIGGSSSPWGGGTITNLVNAGVRFGVDRVNFVRVNFDSLVGEITQPITNNYTEIVNTTNGPVEQAVQRIVLVPDIIFVALDTVTRGTFTTTTTTGPNGEITSNTISVTEGGGALLGISFITTANPATINGGIGAGPGVINPGHFIVINNSGPMALNPNGFFVAETNAIPFFTWGSFGTSTNVEIYPFGRSIEELERQILLGGGGTPWVPSP